MCNAVGEITFQNLLKLIMLNLSSSSPPPCHEGIILSFPQFEENKFITHDIVNYMYTVYVHRKLI